MRSPRSATLRGGDRFQVFIGQSLNRKNLLKSPLYARERRFRGEEHEKIHIHHLRQSHRSPYTTLLRIVINIIANLINRCGLNDAAIGLRFMTRWAG